MIRDVKGEVLAHDGQSYKSYVGKFFAHEKKRKLANETKLTGRCELIAQRRQQSGFHVWRKNGNPPIRIRHLHRILFSKWGCGSLFGQ